jgi:AAA domain-containing protein/DnaB helicase-like protein
VVAPAFNGSHLQPRLRADQAPHDLETERSVLGAMLLYADCVPEVVELRGQDFYLPKHQLIYRTILAVHADRGVSDPLSIRAELERRHRLDEAGGIDALLDLAESCVSAANLAQHVEILREQARRRRVIEAAQDAILQARDPGVDVASVLDRFDVVTERGAGAAARARRIRTWADVATDPPVRWLVDGIVPVGGLVVLAGEPGAGKTLLALDVALRCAHGMTWLGRGCRAASTVYLAGEGSPGLGARLRAWRAAHPQARAGDGHYVAVADGVPDLTRVSAVAELTELLAMARRDHGRDASCVVVDTLAMAAPGADENDAGAVGQVLRVLAELRLRHGVTVIVLHHLRKPQAGSPSSGMHALRGSSAIAGAADVVLLAAADGDDHALRAAKVRDGELPAPLRYSIRAQDTGMARDDGHPEHGPVVLPAATEHVTDADPLAQRITEEQADDAAVVAAVARQGEIRSRDHVASAAGLRAQRGRAALDRVLRDGRIIDDRGTDRRPRFVLPPGVRPDRAQTPSRPRGRARDGSDGDECANPAVPPSPPFRGDGGRDGGRDGHAAPELPDIEEPPADEPTGGGQ